MSRPGAASRPEVAWISAAYGVGGDLLYFEDIFAGLAENFPTAVVPVATDFPIQRYPHLPLAPVFRFFQLGRVTREVDGVAYQSARRILSPTSLVWLARLRPRVTVVTEFRFVSVAAVLVAKLTGSRTVLLIESDPRYRGAPSNRLAALVKARVANGVDTVIVSNELGARYLSEELGLDRSKLTISPYLTSDPARSAPAPVGERHGPVRLLFLNSVNRRKGVLELIRALAATGAELRGSWLLDIYGSGDGEEAARSLVAELGLTEQVRFHGRVGYRDAARCYRDSDVVVAPTLADYRSLSGFEAVNAARPLLISVRDGASEELARRAPAVTVFEPTDTEGFARTLTPFLTRSAHLARQQAAAARVPADFRMSSVVANVARTLNATLAGHRSRE